MFELQNPNEIFKGVIDWQDEDLVISAIMRKKKFISFPQKDRNSFESNNIEMKEFKGKDPSDPEKEIDLVLVRYSR